FAVAPLRQSIYSLQISSCPASAAGNWPVRSTPSARRSESYICLDIPRRQFFTTVSLTLPPSFSKSRLRLPPSPPKSAKSSTTPSPLSPHLPQSPDYFYSGG